MSAETQSDRDRHLLVANFHELMEKDAAIAELEAENKQVVSHDEEMHRLFLEERKRAEQAESERDSIYQACKDTGWEVESGDPERFVAALSAETKYLTLTLASVTMPADAAQVAVQRLRVEVAEAQLATLKEENERFQLREDCDFWAVRAKDAEAELEIERKERFRWSQVAGAIVVEMQQLQNDSRSYWKLEAKKSSAATVAGIRKQFADLLTPAGDRAAWMSPLTIEVDAAIAIIDNWEAGDV